MIIPQDILVGIIGIAILAVSLGVYEQRQINSKKSDVEEPTNSVGGKRKTKKKIKY